MDGRTKEDRKSARREEKSKKMKKKTKEAEAVCAGFIELMAALFPAVVADIVEGRAAKSCIKDKEANELKAGKVNTGRGVRLS